MIDILRGVKNPLKVFLCLALPCVIAGTACGTFGNTAVVVNGHRISQGQLLAEIPVVKAGQPTIADDEAQRQALIAAIENELLREVAVQRHIVPTADQINQRLQTLRTNLGTSFDQQVKTAGYTLATLKSDFIFNNLIVTSLQSQLVSPVTAAEIQTFYDSQKQQLRQVMVKHILFAVGTSKTDAQAFKQANAAMAQLKAGADFATLAKKLSDDPGSKANGGALTGWVPISQVDASFGAAAWAAPIGTVVGPIKSQFGYHLIVTLKKRYQPLAEVSAQIRQSIENQSGQKAIADFVAGLVKRATIVVNPRYGDWDPATQSIVAHQFFRPAPGESPTESPAPQLSLLPTTTP